MKKLIIAEKPDVMRKFKAALEPSAKSICFHKPYVYYHEGDNYIFASAKGHLIRAKMPESISEENKKWTMGHLTVPVILPTEIIPETKDYFQCLQKLVKRKDIDEVVVCTDPDREGQLIWYLISQHLKINVPISRVWIKEWTLTALKKAFDTRKDNKEYHHVEQAGLCRMQADYLIGLTGTRINTVAFGGNGVVINEGRVQSPTRKIVYDNDQAIKNFKPEPYSQILLKTSSEESNPLVLMSARLDEKTAKKIERELSGKSFQIQKESSITSRKCPLLFKTNDIITEAGIKLGLSAEKTTEILQKLYQDYALTTYPRTEIQKISVTASKNVMKIVNSLDGAGIVDDIIDDIKRHKRTFQKHLIDSKGGEMPHEAITPTYDGLPKSKYKTLNQDEKNVYILIVKRFLQGFYPPAQIEETKIHTDIECEGEKYQFTTSGKAIKEASWMNINGIPKDTLLPLVYDKKSYDYIDSEIQEKTTNPPARLTETGLFKAMENAGRYVEDEDAKKKLKKINGIATGGTRAGIVKNLYKNGFLIKKGKAIYPTDKTIQMLEIVPESPLNSPLMTAQLESKLDEVENGILSLEQFMYLVIKQIDEILGFAKNAKKKSAGSVKSTQSSISETCPICGGEIRESQYSYYCSHYKDGCQFSIYKNYSQKKLTASQIKQLISKGETGIIKGFTSANGNKFNARLIYNKDKMKVEYRFDNPSQIVYQCPVCSRPMKETDKNYYCTGYKSGDCHFSVLKTMNQKKLTKSQIEKLLKDGQTNKIKGFISQKGKPFEARLVIDKINQRVKYEF